MNKKNELKHIVIFLNKLQHVNRLLVDYSVPKETKLDIIKRFDSVSTLKDVNKLNYTIKSELDGTYSKSK